MPNGFKKPDFSKGPTSKHLNTIWDAGVIEFNKLETKMSNIDGQLKIIIYMGGGMLALHVAVLAIIAGGE